MTSKSPTIIENAQDDIGHAGERLPSLHSGEVLREEFMVPPGLSADAVAKACDVPRTRIERIAPEETGIPADTTLRLGKLFGTSAAFWLGFQDDHDLETARATLSDDIARIKPIAA